MLEGSASFERKTVFITNIQSNRRSNHIPTHWSYQHWPLLKVSHKSIPEILVWNSESYLHFSWVCRMISPTFGFLQGVGCEFRIKCQSNELSILKVWSHGRRWSDPIFFHGLFRFPFSREPPYIFKYIIRCRTSWVFLTLGSRVPNIFGAHYIFKQQMNIFLWEIDGNKQHYWYVANRLKYGGM